MLFGHRALLISERPGRVIGTLIAAWDGWRGNMYRLAVAVEERRSGVGLALVRAGEEHLRDCGPPHHGPGRCRGRGRPGVMARGRLRPRSAGEPVREESLGSRSEPRSRCPTRAPRASAKTAPDAGTCQGQSKRLATRNPRMAGPSNQAASVRRRDQTRPADPPYRMSARTAPPTPSSAQPSSGRSSDVSTAARHSSVRPWANPDTGSAWGPESGVTAAATRAPASGTVT